MTMRPAMQPIRTMRPAEAGFTAAARRLLRAKLPPAALLAAAAVTVAAVVATTGWRAAGPAPSAAQLEEWQAMVAQTDNTLSFKAVLVPSQTMSAARSGLVASRRGG